MRLLVGAAILWIGVGSTASAQTSSRLFAGGVVGISTLSADARSPISGLLSPPGQRALANFQNLVGVVRAF